MKLQFPFIQLPVTFDASVLADEIAVLGEAVWQPHPQGFAGNSALPLISANGDPANEEFEGPMRPTPLLERLPYLNEVLASLGTVLGRTRLMRLSGNAEVTPHIDQAYYWAERMRVHVPVVTTPGVRFYCGDADINMAAGECWIFDTWRMHRVHNDAEFSRIHLVVDTVGGDGLWELIQRGRPHHVAPTNWATKHVAPRANPDTALEFESLNVPRVMSPWELRAHFGFLFGEAHPHPHLAPMQQATSLFLRHWQALWTAHGEADAARPRYRAILDAFIVEIQRWGSEITLRNSLHLGKVMQSMVTIAALSGGKYDVPAETAKKSAPMRVRDDIFDRPVFIVSPPRSGSTLLFETLTQAPGVYTIGDESHVLIESIPELHPAAQGYASNRLAADMVTAEISDTLCAAFRAALRDRSGVPASAGRVRMLEKTPKNALRIALLARVFPEAQFVYLHRDAREVLASMLAGWQSGRFRTYPKLPGWEGLPWSFLLTPGWRELVGKPLHEIVAAQWQATTRIMLDDLAALPAKRVHVARYDALIADPAAEIARLCAALDFAWDNPFDANLPLSRYTVSKPDPDKWRRHQVEIDAVLPALRDTIARSETFAAH